MPETGNTCTICLTSITEENKELKLDCGHSFHGRCILTWVRGSTCRTGNPACPVCRHVPEDEQTKKDAVDHEIMQKEWVWYRDFRNRMARKNQEIKELRTDFKTKRKRVSVLRNNYEKKVRLGMKCACRKIMTDMKPQYRAFVQAERACERAEWRYDRACSARQNRPAKRTKRAQTR